MTTKKEDIVTSSSSQQASQLLPECCMCGDSGLTHELFQCKVCQFRSQHRYCSNLYPQPESYKVCNWCLSQKEDSKEKSQNSCNSSASCKDNSEDDSKNNIKKKSHNFSKPGSVSPGLKGGQQRNTNNLKLQVAIKKPKSPEVRSPSTTTTTMTTMTTTTTRRKRIITNARLEEKLRRTKSEEISNRGLITRHVFRNKVRRYKLLDEVSS